MTDVLRQHVLPRLQRVKPAGSGQYKASCPVSGHGKGNGDRNPSLSIGPGRTQPVVFSCQAGCHSDDVKAALIGLGIDWSLVSQPRADRPVADLWMPCGHDRAAEYEYRDRDGALRYGTARCVRKSTCKQAFAYWRPDPTKRSGRRWSLKEKDADGVSQRVVPYLPYRLPELLRAIELGNTVWVVEGEKDADRLATLGIAGTCNDGGAGGWNADYAKYLAGADVVVVADRDPAGMGHAKTVIDTLLPIARSLEVVVAAEGKDASDHLDAGKRIGQFVQIAEPIPAPTAVHGCSDCEGGDA